MSTTTPSNQSAFEKWHQTKQTELQQYLMNRRIFDTDIAGEWLWIIPQRAMLGRVWPKHNSAHKLWVITGVVPTDHAEGRVANSPATPGAISPSSGKWKPHDWAKARRLTRSMDRWTGRRWRATSPIGPSGSMNWSGMTAAGRPRVSHNLVSITPEHRLEVPNVPRRQAPASGTAVQRTYFDLLNIAT